MKKYFREAKKIAINGDKKRQHRLGAIGLRADGAIVKSNNLPNRQPEPHAHAEARVVKKLGFGGIVYVVRVLRSGELAKARPCRKCRQIMKFHGVKRCFYSISDNEYGIIEFD